MREGNSDDYFLLFKLFPQKFRDTYIILTWNTFKIVIIFHQSWLTQWVILAIDVRGIFWFLWSGVLCSHIWGFFICSAKWSVWCKCLCQCEKKNIAFKYAKSIKITNNWEEGDKIKLGKQINYFANYPQKY